MLNAKLTSGELYWVASLSFLARLFRTNGGTKKDARIRNRRLEVRLEAAVERNYKWFALLYSRWSSNYSSVRDLGFNIERPSATFSYRLISLHQCLFIKAHIFFIFYKYLKCSLVCCKLWNVRTWPVGRLIGLTDESRVDIMRYIGAPWDSMIYCMFTRDSRARRPSIRETPLASFSLYHCLSCISCYLPLRVDKWPQLRTCAKPLNTYISIHPPLPRNKVQRVVCTYSRCVPIRYLSQCQENTKQYPLTAISPWDETFRKRWSRRLCWHLRRFLNMSTLSVLRSGYMLEQKLSLITIESLHIQ